VSKPRDSDAVADAEFPARIRAERNDFGDHFVSGDDIAPVNR
jgi:hypothetical protein